MCYGYMVSHYLTDLSQALCVLFAISKYPTLFHVAEILWLPVYKRICCKPVCLCINVLRIYGIPLSYWPLSGSLRIICNLKISDFVSCSWTPLASCLQAYMLQDLPACVVMCYGYMVSHYLTDLSQALLIICNLKISDFVSCSWTSLASC